MSETATTGRSARTGATHVAWGPNALIGAAVIALATTGAAATVAPAPALAQHGQGAYLTSGVTMILSDLLMLLGVITLYRSAAVRVGLLKTAGFLLAIAGSVGVVVAEGLLRANFATGATAFTIVGPLQALGLILIGLGVIVTRVWRGWHRYVMLLTGLYVPAVLVPAMAAANGENLLALSGYHALVLMVGIAYLRERTSPSGR